jgi:hypothetical protein
MADASYDVQHLALHAAGWINATGASTTIFGCQMTRSSTGTYVMILDADNGVVDNESFIAVTPKNPSPGAARTVVATDTSNVLKTITVFDNNGSVADAGIEVILWKTVTR